MNKQTIFSGIQPSGKLHIGNYLGALSNFVTLQDGGNYKCFFCLVDYHSISEDYEPKEKRGMILDLLANFLAAGLNPEKSTIFLQSQLPEHTELAWIFDCITPVAEMERMTQYKDKSQRQSKNINMGLFNYPVLMAADILIYKATAVPAGVDQKQHLELANVIARKFNNRFGKFFDEIKPLWTAFPKVMDLKHPDKKMSKSEPEGCLFLDDEPETIKKKITKAVASTEGLYQIGITDTNALLYKADQLALDKPEFRGGINLFKLLLIFNKPAAEDLIKQNSYQYSEIKAILSDSIIKHFAEFREKKKELLTKPDYLAQVLGDGANKARQIAGQTLMEVKQKIGLL
jgi:tryptophanyl-tRNA synthetase